MEKFRLKDGRAAIMPTEEEDARITAAAENDPDSPIWTDEEWANAKPVSAFPDLVETLTQHGKLGRPAMAEDDRKQRVTMYLDRDVIERLKKGGRGWQTRAHAKLREVLGL